MGKNLSSIDQITFSWANSRETIPLNTYCLIPLYVVIFDPTQTKDLHYPVRYNKISSD
jgi:hypothetical protein